jgi:SNF2 family DNA or RNA helicase
MSNVNTTLNYNVYKYNKNSLYNIINDEYPSDRMMLQNPYNSPKLKQFAYYIVYQNIEDYNPNTMGVFLKRSYENVNLMEVESIGIFMNYIVAINIGNLAYLRGTIQYLPKEIWLIIGSIIGCQFKLINRKCFSVDTRVDFYIEYALTKIFLKYPYNTCNIKQVAKIKLPHMILKITKDNREILLNYK